MHLSDLGLDQASYRGSALIAFHYPAEFPSVSLAGVAVVRYRSWLLRPRHASSGSGCALLINL